MEICLATETSAAGSIGSPPWCLYRCSGESDCLMLDLRNGNARCREISVAPFVGVGGSASIVGQEYPGYSAHSKKLAVVELAER